MHYFSCCLIIPTIRDLLFPTNNHQYLADTGRSFIKYITHNYDRKSPLLLLGGIDPLAVSSVGDVSASMNSAAMELAVSLATFQREVAAPEIQDHPIRDISRQLINFYLFGPFHEYPPAIWDQSTCLSPIVPHFQLFQ